MGVWAWGCVVQTADAAVRGSRSLTACLEARQPLFRCLPLRVAANVTCWLPAQRMAATCRLPAPVRGSYLLAACPARGSHLLAACPSAWQLLAGCLPGTWQPLLGCCRSGSEAGVIWGWDGRACVRVGLAHALLRPKACMTLPAAMNLGHEPRTYGDLGIPAILAGTMKAPPRKLWKHHVPSAVGQEILAESHPPVACG